MKRLIPKHQTGNAFINAAVAKGSTPEAIASNKFRLANERAKKISGRIDYSEIDPVTDVLLGAGIGKAIGKGVGKATANLTGKQIRGTLKSFGDMAQRGTYPIRHWGSQGKMQKLSDDIMESYRNPESIKRMQDLGIDSERFLSVNPKVTSRPIGGHYNERKDVINIDLDQIKRLKKRGYNLRDNSVIEHELGHRMQGHQTSPLDQFTIESIPGRISPRPLNIDKRIIKDLPMASDEHLTGNALESKNYFKTGGEEHDYGIERFPHLMETKAEMLKAGVLKNRGEQVTEETLHKYGSYHGGDKNRIFSFIAGGEKTMPILAKYMNKVPVVAGGALGVRALKKKED